MAAFWRRIFHEDTEVGSAVVEFVTLGTMLLIPLIYFILTVGQIQGGSYAVVGAADQAAKVYASARTADDAARQAEQAVALAMRDYGFPRENVAMAVHCAPKDCFAAGSMVTVTVSLKVPLPLIPFLGINSSVTTVDSTAAQVMGRFR
ncbi:hypothetical protein [Psychromicrobium xiongbiense]|uniref:hypothetical protein n=1 Tax=Psychromicrobium xiongbiense TaxID=3051184 RepID=UPI002554B85C|nr:hypothetical protein [Psychromicrobium sp. YIM S02556]